MKNHTVTLPLSDYEEMREHARIGASAIEWWKWRDSCSLLLDAESLEAELIRAAKLGRDIHMEKVDEIRRKS